MASGRRKLKLPDNISLLHLPPYAPELNPVEKIGQFLRQNYLSNRVFPKYQDILDACCNAWNVLASTHSPQLKGRSRVSLRRTGQRSIFEALGITCQFGNKPLPRSRIDRLNSPTSRCGMIG